MADLKMPQINYTVIAGRLTREPELKYTPSGAAVCEIGIAVDNGYGDKKKTSFLSVICWQKTAERAAELKKGAPVIIEGRIETESWDGRDGQKREKTKVIANRIHELAWSDRGEPVGAIKPPFNPDAEDPQDSFF